MERSGGAGCPHLRGRPGPGHARPRPWGGGRPHGSPVAPAVLGVPGHRLHPRAGGPVPGASPRCGDRAGGRPRPRGAGRGFEGPGGVLQQRHRRRRPRRPTAGAGRGASGAGARRHLRLLHPEQGQPVVRGTPRHRRRHQLGARLAAARRSRRARDGRPRRWCRRRVLATRRAQLATAAPPDPGRGGVGAGAVRGPRVRAGRPLRHPRRCRGRAGPARVRRGRVFPCDSTRPLAPGQPVEAMYMHLVAHRRP